MDIFRNLVDRVRTLHEKVDKAPAYKWGTVLALSPLQVRFDGFDEPQVDVQSKTVAVAVGDTVFCVIQNRKVTIIGKAV